MENEIDLKKYVATEIDMNYDKELEKKLGQNCPICGFIYTSKKDYYFSDIFSDYGYCDCCGTEFGNEDDVVDTYVFTPQHIKRLCELRKKWIEGGMQFWYEEHDPTTRPLDWNPILQLKNIPEEFLDEETKQFIKVNEHNYGL